MISANQIGGARVVLTFSMGGRRMQVGDTLTGDEVRAIPGSNRRCLIESGRLFPWPVHAGPAVGERIVVNRGFGKFDVIEGRRLNSEPLTKEEAEALAAPASPATAAA